jgi:integrase
VAHIERRGKGRYRARYRAPDGSERSRTFDRRGDAEKWISAMTNAVSHGEWVDPARGRVTVKDWTDTWLDSVTASLKPYTVQSYKSLLNSRVHPTLGKRRIATLMPSDIQKWVGAMQTEGLSASRIRHAVVVLRQALDAAVGDGRIARNATVGVKLPRLERREAAYLEPEHLERIAAAMPEPYDLLVRVLGTLGLRWGEAAGLQRRHVDLLRRRLRVEQSLAEVAGKIKVGTTKSHAHRSVPLPTSLAKALEQHLDEHVGTSSNAWVFSAGGHPLRHSNFYNRLWCPTLKALGLPHVGVHVTRHSAAAAMISAGANAKAVQTVLGHRSAAFTLTVYGHMYDADLDDLADRLDVVISNNSRPARGLAV